MDSISAFTYDLSFHEPVKMKFIEKTLFLNIRFEPNTDNLIMNLANVGTVESSISTVTIMKVDNQEIIANWVDVNQIIQIKNTEQITIDGVDDSEIVLQGTGVWNDASYVDSDYKISLTTNRGNFFTTVASPFNT